MVLLDDVVIALGAGIATTSLVILLALLSRYQRAVDDAQKSNELAKNLFDALNARSVSYTHLTLPTTERV